MLYSILYISVQYIKFIVHQDLRVLPWLFKTTPKGFCK